MSNLDSRGPGDAPPAPQDEGSAAACAVLLAMANWHQPIDLAQLHQATNLSVTTLSLALHGLIRRHRITSALGTVVGEPWVLAHTVVAAPRRQPRPSA